MRSGVGKSVEHHDPVPVKRWRDSHHPLPISVRHDEIRGRLLSGEWQANRKPCSLRHPLAAVVVSVVIIPRVTADSRVPGTSEVAERSRISVMLRAEKLACPWCFPSVGGSVLVSTEVQSYHDPTGASVLQHTEAVEKPFIDFPENFFMKSASRRLFDQKPGWMPTLRYSDQGVSF